MTNVDGCQVTFENGIIEAVVDRGADNLFTTEMCDALSACLEAPPQGAHVLHIRAEGPAFCLGRERLGKDLRGLQRETAALVRVNTAITASRLVTVAEVQGDAAGFGVGVAALCDISFAGPSVKMRFPEVGMNLTPSIVLAWLPGVVGRKQAFLLTATGMEIDARRAKEIGLITEVAASDETLPHVTRECIASLRQFSPRVHGEIKRFLTQAPHLPDGAAYELGALKLVIAGLTRHVEDHSQGPNGG